jgi:hypothetical protein
LDDNVNLIATTNSTFALALMTHGFKLFQIRKENDDELFFIIKIKNQKKYEKILKDIDNNEFKFDWVKYMKYQNWLRETMNREEYWEFLEFE